MGLSVMTTGPPALGVPQMLINMKDPAFSLRFRVCWVTLACSIFTKTQRGPNEHMPALEMWTQHRKQSGPCVNPAAPGQALGTLSSAVTHPHPYPHPRQIPEEA